MHSLTGTTVATLAPDHPLPSYFAFATIVPPRIRPLAPCRNPVITCSRSAMAQFVGDSQTPIAPEGIPISVPPTLALVRSVPASPSLVQLPPLYSMEQW